MRIFGYSKPDFDLVYQKYADMLYRIVYAQVGNHADTQDIVQDVFLKYLDTHQVFQNEAHVKAWLIRVCINRSHDVQRYIAKFDSEPLSEDHCAVSQDHHSNVMELLQSVSAAHREILILYALEGFSLQECADLLGISLSAAKMRLKRARDELKEKRQEEEYVQ